MASTVLNPAYVPVYQQAETPSLVSRFMQWCTAQNEARLLWLGIILGLHGCVLAPFTGAIALGLGGSFALFILPIVAMAMALVSNLAAMPTKYTLPIFFLSLLIDVAVVVISICIAFL